MRHGALILLISCVAHARSASTQANDGPRNNGGDVVFYLQGLTLDPATLGARTTNRVRVQLF